jgi:metallo-beta-lactamase class B
VRTFAIPLVLGLAALNQDAARPSPTPSDEAPSICAQCDEWNQPQAPFKLHGRSYYVGTRGLSAVVIQTSAGLILLDGGLPQSAPLIEANLRTLGLKVEDIRFILSSHAHYDHAGGIARLQRKSGAVVVSSESGARALRTGKPVPDDPQYGLDGRDGVFPSVASVKVMKDNEELRLGDTVVTARLTPGHTPGSTTWTWRSCEGGACKNLVYADSLTAVSSDGFRFLGTGTGDDRSEQFRRTIQKVSGLPCDLMLTTHPSASRLFERLDRRASSPTVDPLIDPGGCRRYAEIATKNLELRLEKERKQP